MQKTILSIILLIINLPLYSQTNDYKTIAYLTNKNEIELKAKLLSLDEDTFLKIRIENSILPEDLDINENEINLIIEVESDKNYFNSSYFKSINFDNENALFFLDKKQLKLLKENPIKSIKIDYLNGTEYIFKNIKISNFFQQK